MEAEADRALNDPARSREEYKARISRELADRLHGNAAWQKYVKTRERLLESNKPQPAFPTPEQRAAQAENLEMAAASELVHNWASSSGDHYPPGVAMQRAIKEEFGLQESANELVGNLSHGDQRRVEIAVCMALKPRLLMLDEPTQGMSPSETAEFDALIKSLTGRVTILLIEHDVDLVMSLSDHVIVMHQGEKLFEGAPDHVRASPLVREAYLGVDHAAA